MLSLIYKVLKVVNDVKAVKNGRIVERLGWRVAGKLSGKLFGKWFK